MRITYCSHVLKARIFAIQKDLVNFDLLGKVGCVVHTMGGEGDARPTGEHRVRTAHRYVVRMTHPTSDKPLDRCVVRGTYPTSALVKLLSELRPLR